MKKTLLRKLSLLPVWALTLLFQPLLPRKHPWKYQALTLQSWHEQGTDFAVEMGIGLWISGLGFLYATWFLTHARAFH